MTGGAAERRPWKEPTMTKRVRIAWAGLVLTAALTIVAMMPTAIEYAVMLGGITFNAID